MYKKFIKLPVAIITLCIVLFNYTCNCYAVSSNVTVDSWMQQLGDAVRTFTITLEAGEHLTSNALREYVKKSFDSVGFLIDESGVLLEKIKTAIHGVDPNFDYQTATEDYIGQWIVDNTEVINGDVVFGDKYNSFIKEYNDNYVEENKINIWYCCSVQASSSNDLVNGFLEDAVPIMDEFKNNCYYLLRTSNSGTTYFYVIPKMDCMIYGVQSAVFSNQWHGFNLYRCKDISGIITYEPILVRDSLCTVYLYGSDGHLTLINDHSTIDQGYAESQLGAYYYYQAGHGTEGHDFLRYPKGISKYGDTIETFLSTSALDTYIHSTGVGLQPYYYNNQVWNNFSQSSGDYTVGSGNVNTVTYGDTVTYIQDSYNQTGNYPDIDNVNNWIETTNNNNNGSGGGSGGSGGSGDDSGGSGSGIVSILTALGKAIADLITGIAAFIAEVVGGLVEAITGLLDTLTDLITNFTESIPNIFSPLLGWLFDGLPEEFTAIILLGLTACVIASIIKILRG